MADEKEKEALSWWVIGAAIFVIVSGIGVVVVLKPRGIRNNNPGNLVDNGINWEGLDDPRNDATMVKDKKGRLPLLRFTSAFYGIRALAIDVLGDIIKDGKNTIRKLVAEYAPASDGNNEKEYRATLAKRLGIGEDDIINPTIHLRPLLDGISQAENSKTLTGEFGFMTTESAITTALRYKGYAV